MSKQKNLSFPPQATQKLDQLKIKIFADGAVLDEMLMWHKNPYVTGFTTNPSLMKAANIDNYKAFAHKVLDIIKNDPISFETFADDMTTMEMQAREIATWGNNVYIKIPITNTKGKFTGDVIERLSTDGIALNITAIMTLEQVKAAVERIKNNTSAIISVFSGRIADTGIDPIPIMKQAAKIVHAHANVKLLWASSREIFNIFQAEEVECDIITIQPSILHKLNLLGKDLNLYSLETVKQFHIDASAANYTLA